MKPTLRWSVVVQPSPAEQAIATTKGGWRSSVAVDIASTGDANLTGAVVRVYAVTRAGRSLLASGNVQNLGGTERVVEVINRPGDWFEVTMQTGVASVVKAVNAQVSAWGGI